MLFRQKRKHHLRVDRLTTLTCQKVKATFYNGFSALLFVLSANSTQLGIIVVIYWFFFNYIRPKKFAICLFWFIYIYF